MSYGTFAEHESYPFTDEQLARLAVYKIAIAAGFYRDDLGDQPETASFTAQEISRLGAYRAAVRAGFFNEASPVGDHGTNHGLE